MIDPSEDPPVASLEPDTVIVLYEASSGQAVHVHQEVTLPGGAAPTPESQIARAMAFARETAERETLELKSLRVDPAQFRKFRRLAFAVDLSTGTMVERATKKDRRRKKN